MTEIDYEWVKSQFKAARVSQLTGDAVLALLKTWETQNFPTDQAAEEALDVFSKLARTNALVGPNPEETWVPAGPGFMLQVGHEIRVKQDAFSGKEGTLHNGRRGKVVGIRSGDVIMRSNDGREPFLDGVHYPFHKLEKRVR